MTFGPIRARLRDATRAAHTRLHGHPGLSAAATGRISLDDYRALLARLYGFHRPFEASICTRASAPEPGRMRAGLLASDLEALGVTGQMRDALPFCTTLPALSSNAEILGALYVMEGSTLGGVQIARALQPLLAPLSGAGGRFFSNDGAPPRDWGALIARTEALQGDAHQERVLVASAVSTFQLFDEWMEDWTLAPEK